MKNWGKVYLVGAGPGNPELLTLKAARLLERADVVLYDRLVGEEILEFIGVSAQQVYVGKKCDRKGFSIQEQVNSLLVKYAGEGKVVVRLKGGDPFVFGRGGEEALYLAKHGITFEVVPGVSSVASVPASALIPLTCRGVSSAFAVFSAHKALGSHEEVDWKFAALAPTAVFLMGVKRLPEITKQLIANGRESTTPIAIIANGTRDDEQVIVGTLATICSQIQELMPPAIIVVGEVVNIREELLSLYKSNVTITGRGDHRGSPLRR